MSNADKIASELCKEFEKKYGPGWHLLTDEVKAALVLDRAILNLITFGRRQDGSVDVELLADVREAIRHRIIV